MSVLAKLLWMHADQVRDPDGTDELVMVRKGGVQFWPTSGLIRMQQDTTEDLDVFLPISEGRDVEIELFEQEQPGSVNRVDSVFIDSNEVGRGEQTQQFRGNGALYTLWYTVF